LKLGTIVVAIVASIVITFGNELWYVGVILLALALLVRFGIAIGLGVKSEGNNVKELDHKVRTPESYIEPNKPLSMFEPFPPKIRVIGLGGGGGNAITRMVREKIEGAEFIAINTDAQALAVCEATTKLQIGKKLTGGLGVGGDPNLGLKAAEESRDKIKELVSEADMVFITAGMGGGTGTGSAAIVAEEAKQSGALTIGIVTLPFTFEGVSRRQIANEGIIRLFEKVDTLVIIPNDRLLNLCGPKTSIDNAFRLADDVLRQGVQAITEVVTKPGLINLDFADINAVMKDTGPAWMSVGIGVGKDRAVDAAKEALASPLIDVSIEGARAVLFNIVSDSSLTLFEVNKAAEVIKQAVSPEANIIFGVAHDPSLENEARVTIIATEFISKPGADMASQENALTELLKNLESQEETKLSSFPGRYPSQRN